jgi:predicted RNase H-like nuclease (RuvC/YqgF family)
MDWPARDDPARRAFLEREVHRLRTRCGQLKRELAAYRLTQTKPAQAGRELRELREQVARLSRPLGSFSGYRD